MLEPAVSVGGGVVAFRNRHHAAIRLANAYMEKSGLNQHGLARRVGVSPSLLSRFLNPLSGRAPGPRSPAMTRLLEELERICSVDLDVFEMDPTPGERVDDEWLWYDRHRKRLRVPRDKLDPGEALARIGVLCAQAVNGPSAHRAAMCANTLLALGFVLHKLEARSASRDLLSRTTGRVDHLHETGMNGVEGNSEIDLKIEGYTGLCHALTGYHMQETSRIGSGVREMLEVAVRPHRRVDALWCNPLEFTDRLLGESHGSADGLSMEVARVAYRNQCELLRDALRTRTLAHLKNHWRVNAPLMAPLLTD